MIQAIEIKGYRGFSHFEMQNLGNVNLLVGRNNSGKTSVLEMLNLLVSGGGPDAIWRIVARRGERLYIESSNRSAEQEYEVGHLFNGHELRAGAHFSVTAKNQSPTRSVKCTVAEYSKDQKEGDPRRNVIVHDDGSLTGPFFLHMSGIPAPPMAAIPLSRRGGLRPEYLEASRRTQRNALAVDNTQVQYISTESLTFETLAVMWNQISLRPEQDRVVQALRYIEPTVEALAPQISLPNYYIGSRGGFIVKLTGLDQPIPIGSLGDGAWRMLALAIALSRAQGGVLLVDEIDTGMHYTVMADMWKLIAEAAKNQNVQVFATTHSYDCVHSLAAICNTEASEENAITIQRIDPLKKRAVVFTEAEIRMIAERGIEVR
jgi:predicted ATPase